MTIPKDKLFKFLYDNLYFTCSNYAQYLKLLEANEMNAPLEELATIIWICSDDKRRIDILDNLKDIYQII